MASPQESRAHPCYALLQSVSPWAQHGRRSAISWWECVCVSVGVWGVSVYGCVQECVCLWVCGCECQCVCGSVCV